MAAPLFGWSPSAREPAHRLRADVVVDVLFLLVFLEPRRAQFTADPGLSETAPLGLREIGVEIVDPHRSVPQRRRHALRPAGIGGPDRTGQAIAGVIGDPERLLLG